MTGPDDFDVVRGAASSDDVHALQAALLKSAFRTGPVATDPLSLWRAGRRQAMARHPESSVRRSPAGVGRA